MASPSKDLSQMREEFATHDVFQDHVDIAGVVEWAEHVHDEGMLQLGQNPKRRWRPGFYATLWWFTIRSWLEPAGAKHGTWEQTLCSGNMELFLLRWWNGSPLVTPFHSPGDPNIPHLSRNRQLDAKALLLAHDVVYLLHLDDCCLPKDAMIWCHIPS